MTAPTDSLTRRRRWRLMLAYAVVLLPTIVLGAVRALEANNNSPIDWVTSDFAPRAAYDEFCKAFGPGDAVVMSWPGCTLYETRLDTLLSSLRSDPRFFDASHNWLFTRVTSGREAALTLTARRAPSGGAVMTTDHAIDRLRSNLVGPDRRTTAVVVVFTPGGLKLRERLVGDLRGVVHETIGVEPEELRLAGPVIDGLGVDLASQRTLALFAAPSSALVFLLCWVGLRSLRAAAVVFALSALCQGAALALLHYNGGAMNALMIVLPPMVQVLSVSAGLHLMNYYFDSGAAGEEGARAALREGWAPCVLSAATTAIGMLSLTASGLTPIRQFGAYAAAGVLLSTAMLLGLLPAVLCWLPLQRSRPGQSRESVRNRAADAWMRLIVGRRYWVVGAGVATIVLGGWQASRIDTSVRIETLFSPGHRIVEDYAWIEEHVGPLVSLDVVVAFPECVTPQQRMTLLWRIGRRISQIGGFSAPVSAATLSAPYPDLWRIPEAAHHQAIDQFADAQSPMFEALGVKTTGDTQGERWRVTTYTTALGDADYSDLLHSVRQAVDQAITETGSHAKATVTGVMPLVHEIQAQLLDDLLMSFAGALVLISVTMTLVQAGVVPGLVAMASNVFPIAVYFGWLGWRGQPIDIGVVMTAGVALGVAVDDTLHFLTFFQRGIDSGLGRTRAVREAIARCAPAMIQTSVSCGVGLLVFALSDFAPTCGFAISMAVLLTLALVGDLLLLPALLIGFAKEKTATELSAASEFESAFEQRNLSLPAVARRPRSAA